MASPYVTFTHKFQALRLSRQQLLLTYIPKFFVRHQKFYGILLTSSIRNLTIYCERDTWSCRLRLHPKDFIFTCLFWNWRKRGRVRDKRWSTLDDRRSNKKLWKQNEQHEGEKVISYQTIKWEWRKWLRNLPGRAFSRQYKICLKIHTQRKVGMKM